jgi:hypothetical protein
MMRTTVALACTLGIAAMLPVSADQTKVRLDADTGLWEVVSRPQTPGGAQEHVVRECLTVEQRAKGFDLGANDTPSCKTRVIRNTSRELEARRECTPGHDLRTLTEHLRMSGPRHVSGTMDMVVSHEGKLMTMHMIVEGRWLAAECGAVRDVQPVK